MSDTDNVTALKLFRDNLMVENGIGVNDIIGIKVDAKSIGKKYKYFNSVLATFCFSCIGYEQLCGW